MNNINLKHVMRAALCIAVATALSFIKIGLPFGGSVTLCSMLFVSVVGFAYGPRVGFTAAVAYGLLQCLIEPYVVHPVQFLLDYPVAFGMLGVSGLFTEKRYGVLTGFLTGALLRGAVSTLSGVIFFAANAPVGQPALLYSIIYNASYIIPEIIITMVMLSVPAVRKTIVRLLA